jgi:futalosine hydrolase
MEILIVSATQKEVEFCAEKFESFSQINSRLKKINTANNNFYFLHTGVGMIATTYYLTQTLNKYKIDCVINAGIAGAINNIAIGEVVNVVNDCFYELGAEDALGFIPISEMNLFEDEDFPLNQKNISFNNIFKSNPIINNLKEVNGITVNKVHGNDTSITQLKSIIDSNVTYTESMEGASVGYVCTLQNVACLQIRSISNMVEPRNKNNWNIPLSIKKLNEVLFQLLMSL